MGYFHYVDNINIGNYGTAYSANALTPPPLPSFSIGSGASTAPAASLMPPIFNLSAQNYSSYSTNGTSSTSYDYGNNSITTDENAELKPGLLKGKLAGKEALVTRLCKKYHVSVQLVVSIIGIESSFGTSDLAVNHNNFMGYRSAGDLGKDKNGHGYFSTVEKGLEAGIRNLAGYTKYSDVASVDFEHLDAIGRHYCEKGNWAYKVRDIYNKNVRQYIA